MGNQETATAPEKEPTFVETGDVVFFKNRRLKVGDRVGFQTRPPGSNYNIRPYTIFGTLTKVEVAESEVGKVRPDSARTRITVVGARTAVVRQGEGNLFNHTAQNTTRGPYDDSSISHWLE